MAIEKTADLAHFLVGKKLTSINLYNENDHFLCFNQKKLALIDGGIELGFDKEIISLAWNEKEELFDIAMSPADGLLGSLDYYQISTKDLPIGSDLQGLTIKSANVQWSWYQNVDENFEPIGEKQYIPIELIIEFDHGRVLQIATVDCNIEDGKIQSVSFNSEGELLLSVDTIFEITTHEAE
ncbi:MAG: hypothetical protein R2784_21340 [Saprospiraceae bacterium]